MILSRPLSPLWRRNLSIWSAYLVRLPAAMTVISFGRCSRALARSSRFFRCSMLPT